MAVHYQLMLLQTAFDSLQILKLAAPDPDGLGTPTLRRCWPLCTHPTADSGPVHLRKALHVSSRTTSYSSTGRERIEGTRRELRDGQRRGARGRPKAQPPALNPRSVTIRRRLVWQRLAAAGLPGYLHSMEL